MEIREYIENLVKRAPGVKSNQDLIGEMIEESIRRAEGFLENNSLQDSEAYIKKIVNMAVVDVIKNGDKIRANKSKKEQEANKFQQIEIEYKTDKEGKIVYDVDIDFSEEELVVSEEKINLIKDRINKLDKEYPNKRFKQIFELRYVRNKDYQNTAQKLDMEETDVLKVLDDIFKEIQLVLAS